MSAPAGPPALTLTSDQGWRTAAEEEEEALAVDAAEAVPLGEAVAEALAVARGARARARTTIL
jgi:hypothetical protein